MGDLVQLASYRDRDGQQREPFVTKKEILEALSISPSTLQRKMQAEKKRPGTGIPFYKLGDSDAAPVRFLMSEAIEAVVRSQEHDA